LDFIHPPIATYRNRRKACKSYRDSGCRSHEIVAYPLPPATRTARRPSERPQTPQPRMQPAERRRFDLPAPFLIKVWTRGTATLSGPLRHSIGRETQERQFAKRRKKRKKGRGRERGKKEKKEERRGREGGRYCHTPRNPHDLAYTPPRLATSFAHHTPSKNNQTQLFPPKESV